MIIRGWALAELGQGEAGIAQIGQGLAAALSTGAEFFRTYFLALLAHAHHSVGQSEAGLTVLAEALAQVEKTGERFWEAELYRLKGELLLMQDRGMENKPTALFVEVETCFHQAIEIARRQQAKSLELRATTSLCRLWQAQGRRAEAHALLAEIYGWFTEGFDTSDLIEAQTLLESLSDLTDGS